MKSKIYLNEISSQTISNILDQFDNNKSIKYISNYFNISTTLISKILKLNNKTIISNRKYDYLRKINFSDLQKEFLVGTLLGDSSLYKDGINYKLSFGHCKAQEEYFKWKVSVMSPFITKFRESIDKRGNSIMLQTTSISHPGFNEFANLFYKDRVKIVPNNLEKYFSPITLAALIQDDGSLNSVNVRLASMGFSKEDNQKLQYYFKNCFDLNSNLLNFKYKSKLYYQITFNKENSIKLSNIISHCTVPSMSYKLLK